MHTVESDHAPTSDLAGRVAIVTGAGSQGDGIGNGRAISIVLARAGAAVVAMDSHADRVGPTVTAIQRAGGQAIAVVGDVTESAACERAVREATEAFDGVHILVNNVGVSGPSGSAVATDADAWDAGFQVNVKSMMLMAKYAIPVMERQGHGAIINISSAAGLFGGNPNLFYATTKGAILSMTRAMAAHHGEQGIRVNAIAPGMVYTPMVTAKGMSDERRRLRRERSLLKTEGSAWDVANAALYLASDLSRWVTGVVLPVDAGATAGRSITEHPNVVAPQ